MLVHMSAANTYMNSVVFLVHLNAAMRDRIAENLEQFLQRPLAPRKPNSELPAEVAISMLPAYICISYTTCLRLYLTALSLASDSARADLRCPATRVRLHR